MAEPRHLYVTVQFDSQVRSARSLAWIAPELKDADLEMIDDHAEGPVRSRTWAGSVDEATFAHFVEAWHLSDVIDDAPADQGGDHRPGSQAYSVDGMNWEVEGISPIVCVSVQVDRD